MVFIPVKVRCLPDAPADLFPYWVHAQDCDGLENAAADMLFWNSTGDESCAAQAHLIFLIFYSHKKFL
jgi:hypothetical protein